MTGPVRPLLAALALAALAACGSPGPDGMVGDTPVGEVWREDAGASENAYAGAP